MGLDEAMNDSKNALNGSFSRYSTVKESNARILSQWLRAARLRVLSWRSMTSLLNTTSRDVKGAPSCQNTPGCR